MRKKNQNDIVNQELIELIHVLKNKARENKASIWLNVAKKLNMPKRRRTIVNLSRINRYTKMNDKVVIPGKVLGSGLLNHQVSVAAFSFSEQAKQKILTAKGECLSIYEMTNTNPKGSNVKVLG